MSVNFIPSHDAPDNAPHRRNVNQNNLAVFTVDRIMILRWLINQLRDMRKQTIKSDDMTDEQLYYLQEGFREGLCAAAMMMADELDKEYSELLDGMSQKESFLEKEKCWWHTHDNLDIGSKERL